MAAHLRLSVEAGQLADGIVGRDQLVEGPYSSAGVDCTTIRPPVATSARDAVKVASSM
jgi:hypothetical protein